MGTRLGQKWRDNMRQDTHCLRNMLARARHLIFERGFGAGSAAIKRLLDAKSLLPVQVRPLSDIVTSLPDLYGDRAHFPFVSRPLTLISTSSFCRTSCMKLS